jgi:hypothetical protein
VQEFWSSDSLPVYQSTAARLHQKVQECNVMARGMSSIVRPSLVFRLPCSYNQAATGRESIIRGGRSTLPNRLPDDGYWYMTNTCSTTQRRHPQNSLVSMYTYFTLSCSNASTHTQDTLDSMPRFAFLHEFTISNILRSHYKSGLLSHRMSYLSLSLSLSLSLYVSSQFYGRIIMEHELV